MLKKTKKGYYVLKKLAKQEGVIHGFSTRKFGNMRIKKSLGESNNLDKFLKVLDLKKGDLIMMEQFHGNKVKEVGKREAGSVVKGVDGLVTDKPGIVLGVKVADCLPLLFFDKKKRIIGIAHAGWKGILAEIDQEVVEKMKLLGSNPKDILVGIGPHIGSCCYQVKKDLLEKFIRKFGSLKEMILKKGGKTYLDLMVPLRVQLIKVGVLGKNIENSSACTFCQNNDFFSYRKENNQTYGEILGVISLIKQ